MGLCNTKCIYNIRDEYKFHEQIGKGVMATVYRAIHAKTYEEFAIKVINKIGLYPEEILDVLNEVKVLKLLNHPNIVKMKEFIEDTDCYYILMEFVCGGELRERIIKKKVYTEKEARNLSKNLISTVLYMHNKGVVHRDLKLDNLMLCEDHDCETIKIVDFGVATEINGKTINKLCGTPWYISPEILRNEDHSFSVDMWSIGVIIYMLLCGRPPFCDDNQSKLFSKIKSGNYSFQPTLIWDHISMEAKDLIHNLLSVDPSTRLTAAQALEHPWMYIPEDILMQHHLENVQDELSSCCSSLSHSINTYGSIRSGCSISSNFEYTGVKRTETFLH